MRDVRAIVGWLWREVRAAGAWLGEPGLWAVLVAALALWALAYQWPYAHRLDLGGDLATRRREDDAPYLNDTFNGSEPGELTPATTQVYRWARERATITLPGLGGGTFIAHVRAASGRPDSSTVVSRWGQGTHTAAVTLQGQPRVYHIIVAAGRSGDLALHFETPPYRSQTDPRSLGMVAFRAQLTPTIGWRLPAPGQIALLAVSLALVYGLARRLLLAPRPALASALAFAGLLALLLAGWRLPLTIFSPTLAALLACCYGLGVVLDTVAPTTEDGGWRMEDGGWSQRPSSTFDPLSSFFSSTPSPLHPFTPSPLHLVTGSAGQSPLAALVVLAFGLRLGGLLHPHAISSDLGLNVHNLLDVTIGQIYFTEALPGDIGGAQAPYLPGLYLALAPAQLLLSKIDDSARSLLLLVGSVLWDSLVVAPLWLLLRRGAGPRAALLGAALYVVPPPLLKSFSIGELANIFGQGLALPPLVLLALAPSLQGGQPSRLARVALPALLALALLGHLGVVISLVLVLGCLSLGWLARRQTRPHAVALVGAALAAALLVALCYYSAFGALLVERPLGAATAGSASGEKLLGLVQKLFSADSPLSPLMLVVGAAGLGMLMARPRSHAAGQTGLGPLMLAWWGGTILSLGLLLVADQGVRWQHFLYPALCLGGGLALAALWARGRAGRFVAGAGLAFLLWYGAAFWVSQIVNYLH